MDVINRLGVTVHHGLWVSRSHPAISGHRANYTVDDFRSKLILILPLFSWYCFSRRNSYWVPDYAPTYWCRNNTLCSRRDSYWVAAFAGTILPTQQWWYCGIIFCQAETGPGSSLREWKIWDWYLQEESVITITLCRISNSYRRSLHTRTTVSKNLDRSAKKCGNENKRPRGSGSIYGTTLFLSFL